MATPALRRLTHTLRQTFEADRLGGLPDCELLARFLARRDAAAFEALVRRHGPLVLAACRKVLGDGADDAFQATFLVLLRQARSIRRLRSVGPWLYGVAHRIAVRARADALRRRRREADAATPADAAATADLSWREACAVLHEELDRLPENYRLPLLLCYLEGKSRDEAAQQLGWSPGALKGRLERGRERLRRQLERRGLAPAVGLLAVGVAAPAALGSVPPGLVDSTLNLAFAPAARAAEVAQAVLLARGVERAMTTVRRTTWATALLLAGAVGVGLAVAAARPGGGPPAAAKAADAGPGPAAPGRAVAVSGRVLGPDGKPFAGVKVYLPVLPGKVMKVLEHAGEEEVLKHVVSPVRATTGADGTFRFTVGLGEGDFSPGVVAVADGFGPDQAEFPRNGVPPAEAAGLTLRLVPDDVPVRGRLMDTEGRPVPGAAVTLLGVEVPPGGDLTAYLKEYGQDPRRTYGKNRYLFVAPPLVAAVSVGADGRFTLRGVGRDRIAVLRVTGTAAEETVLHVLTGAGLDAKSIPRPAPDAGGLATTYGPAFTHVVSPARGIMGTVRERGTGRPVAGVRVWGNGPDFHNQAHAVTDAAGRYRLTGLAKGSKRRLVLYPPEGSPLLGATREMPDEAGLAAQRADFELARGVVVTGRLTDRTTGRPVRGNLSYLPLPDNTFLKELPDPRERFDRTSQPTGADGRFRAVVMPGSGILMVQTEENRFRPAPRPTAEEDKKSLAVRPDGMFVNGFGDYSSLNYLNAYRVFHFGKDDTAATCDLTVDPGTTLAGVVLDPDGKPLPGSRVRGLTHGWGPLRTLAGAEFKLLALAPPEPRVLVAWHDGRKLAGTATVRGDEAAPVKLSLRPAGAVTGRVVAADGRPLAGARVHYSYRDDKGREIELFNAGQDLPVVVTDKDGRFRIDGLVPGLGAKVCFDSASKGGKFFVPDRGKLPTWRVKSGAVEEIADVPVQLARP
jgi:RNA polymerase sigma factor (sigma-70 family)